MNFKVWLRDELNETGRFFQKRATQDPAAASEMRSARALYSLATYIQFLDRDDPRLRTLEELLCQREDTSPSIRVHSQAFTYLTHLGESNTPAPPSALLDGLIRTAASDVASDVKREISEEELDLGDGRSLTRIALLAQRMIRLNSELDVLLREAAERNVSWTVLADLSGFTRQTLASRYRQPPAPPVAKSGKRAYARREGTGHNPTCASCNHPTGFHKGGACSVAACSCSEFVAAEEPTAGARNDR